MVTEFVLQVQQSKMVKKRCSVIIASLDVTMSRSSLGKVRLDEVLCVSRPRPRCVQRNLLAVNARSTPGVLETSMT